jgi:hypothetical protein
MFAFYILVIQNGAKTTICVLRVVKILNIRWTGHRARKER